MRHGGKRRRSSGTRERELQAVACARFVEDYVAVRNAHYFWVISTTPRFVECAVLDWDLAGTSSFPDRPSLSDARHRGPRRESNSPGTLNVSR